MKYCMYGYRNKYQKNQLEELNTGYPLGREGTVAGLRLGAAVFQKKPLELLDFSN